MDREEERELLIKAFIVNCVIMMDRSLKDMFKKCDNLVDLQGNECMGFVMGSLTALVAKNLTHFATQIVKYKKLHPEENQDNKSMEDYLFELLDDIKSRMEHIYREKTQEEAIQGGNNDNNRRHDY